MRKWIVIILLLGTYWAKGQGCSDPGICTIGTLNSATSKDSASAFNVDSASLEDLLNATFVDEKWKASIAAVYGLGAPNNFQLYTSTFRFSYRLKKRVLLNIKVPVTYVTGDLGSNSGVGDITLSLQNTFYNADNKRIAYIAGVVIPTGDANNSDNGFVLPMQYQTTLGAFNALAGLSATYKGWSGSFGYQHSFGANGNTFSKFNLTFDPNMPGYDPLNPTRAQYVSSNKIIRSGDLFLRLEKRFKFKNLGFYIGALPIYRVAESTVLTETNGRQSVTGSDGLTFNATAGVNYNFSRNASLRFIYGMPFVQRTALPDGLGRRQVMILSYTHKMW